MGVGALIKVFQLLFPIIFIEEYDQKIDVIKKMDVEFFEERLQGLQKIDFSKQGEFGRSGSSGGMNKIKERIIENLDYLNYSSYSDFEEFFKKPEGILNKYKNWLRVNLIQSD